MSASESQSIIVLGLAEEFLGRYRRGERPSLKEYIDRHPELAAEIREVFPAVALMENVALADESLTGDTTGSKAAPGGVSPRQLGDYRILREVGRGGMGIVYEAQQVSLGRHVALKVLPRKLFVDAQQRRRFEREARSAAKLHHTNIVPVFGVGEHDGMPYFVMQFIQGLGLDQVLKELKRLQADGIPAPSGDDSDPRGMNAEALAGEMARSLVTGVYHKDKRQGESEAVALDSSDDLGITVQLSDTAPISSPLNLPGSAVKGKKASYWQSVAHIGVQVAHALEYAHKQGILHRDIKPSNLMLDTRGTVWVTDFGLARAENEEHLTQTGDIVGTLRYMPPEAFEGRGDRRSDIYSLGLTLYELLALQPAFAEKDRPQLIKRVTTEEPTRLGKLNRAVPRDLATIVHKAIDREPLRRYATANELAADLQRFVDDEPVQARPITNGERLLRWGRRNRSFALLSAVALFLLVTVALVSTVSALRLLAEQRRANKAERDILAVNVKGLLTASADSVPSLVDTLKPRAGEVLPALEERERETGAEFVPRLRLNVALAVLGRDRCRQLCDATTDTPPAESFNLLLGLTSGDRAAAVTELWHRYQQAQEGEGRTRLAVALLELGDPRAARGELALKENLTARSRFIHRFSTWHGNLAAIADLLRTVDDGAFRSGLCLAVAGMDTSRLSAPILRSLDEVLTQLYLFAPDGGTHGAAEYALRHRGLPLPEIKATQGPVEGRRWFINRQGMTLLAVEPGWFYPSSYARPAGPDGRAPQTILLTRPFFMGDQEVTTEWYRRFLQSTDHPEGEELTDAARQGDFRHSLACINQRSAVLFCNWLSRAEGRKPCYRPAGPGQAIVCDFTANGYRLPTDAEWEHAFRCGTTTRFFVGEDVERILEYGRVIFAIGPGPGKCFFPNPHGLFDMLGNAWEKCWDQGIPQYGSGLSINPIGPVGDQHAMRGGAADAGLFYLHGSARILNNPNANEGFRVVCGPLNPEDVQGDQAIALGALNRFVEQYANSVPDRGRKPVDPEVWKERGRLHFELGQTDEATADFRQAVELLGDRAEPAKPAESEADKLFARLAADVLFDKLTTAVEEKPTDVKLRWNRGEWYARHRRWKEAAADFALALQRQPPDSAYPWLHAAPALVAAGDREGYRRLCREMLQRFRETPSPLSAERIAKASLLLPETGKETEEAGQLAERSVTSGKNAPWKHFFVSFAFCKGLADYRQGNFRAAIGGIEPLLPATASIPDLNVHCHLVLAMALHRHGDTKGAHKHLTQAAKLLDQHVQEPIRFPRINDLDYHHDWLIAWLLYREAKTLIEDEKAEPNE